MFATCPLQIVGLVNLVLAPILITAAITCALMARHARILSEQAQQATRNAAMLTTRVVAQAAPFLECQVCGMTLDPQRGVTVGLDTQGQLQLRCADHQDQVA